MGAVKKYLAEKVLRDRERHNSRLFVDLCENIHIHFREYRLMISLDEYFEFVDVISKSTRDVRNYLCKNPGYKEGVYPTTLMVACGGQRQVKFLKNSPQPNVSAYDNHRFAIELQEEHITDEIHVHWRDLRIVLNRENFKDVAQAFEEAHEKLNEFEKRNNYCRQSHFDREVVNYNNAELDGESVQGLVKLSLDKITSYWFKDMKSMATEWKHDKEYIDTLMARFLNNEPVAPLIVSQANQDGTHHIVNGHHRYLAAQKVGRQAIDAVIVPMSFEETEDLRKAELHLKSFDEKTEYKYGFTSFLNDYVAFKLNRFYANDFQPRVRQAEAEQLAAKRGKLERIGKKIRDRFSRKRVGASLSEVMAPAANPPQAA